MLNVNVGVGVGVGGWWLVFGVWQTVKPKSKEQKIKRE
jgi:hypothetical protein